ncbi:hypothetical protein ACRAWD_16030 [Caulobacter segnis]
MNTTHLGSVQDLKPYPEVATSVLNYGVPDMAGKLLQRGSHPGAGPRDQGRHPPLRATHSAAPPGRHGGHRRLQAQRGHLRHPGRRHQRREGPAGRVQDGRGDRHRLGDPAGVGAHGSSAAQGL